MMSGALPAEKPTISLIGRSGNAAHAAGLAVMLLAPNAAMKERLFNLAFLLAVWVGYAPKGESPCGPRLRIVPDENIIRAIALSSGENPGPGRWNAGFISGLSGSGSVVGGESSKLYTHAARAALDRSQYRGRKAGVACGEHRPCLAHSCFLCQGIKTRASQRSAITER